MEKNFVNDVYTIHGIDSTSQLVAFYKEVVDKNIEKYVGITTQGIKFKLDNTGERALQLKANEEYGINPMYRKIEVEPIEEVVQEAESVPVEVESIEEVIAETAAQDVVEPKEIHEVVEQAPVEQVSNEKFEQLQISLEQANQKCVELIQERNLCKERAEEAELREEQLIIRNKELISIVAEKDTAILELTEKLNAVKQAQAEHVCSNTPLTLDETLEHIKTLGYEAFIRKI